MNIKRSLKNYNIDIFLRAKIINIYDLIQDLKIFLKDNEIDNIAITFKKIVILSNKIEEKYFKIICYPYLGKYKNNDDLLLGKREGILPERSSKLIKSRIDDIEKKFEEYIETITSLGNQVEEYSKLKDYIKECLRNVIKINSDYKKALKNMDYSREDHQKYVKFYNLLIMANNNFIRLGNRFKHIISVHDRKNRIKHIESLAKDIIIIINKYRKPKMDYELNKEFLKITNQKEVDPLEMCKAIELEIKNGFFHNIYNEITSRHHTLKKSNAA